MADGVQYPTADHVAAGSEPAEADEEGTEETAEGTEESAEEVPGS